MFQWYAKKILSWFIYCYVSYYLAFSSKTFIIFNDKWYLNLDSCFFWFHYLCIWHKEKSMEISHFFCCCLHNKIMIYIYKIQIMYIHSTFIHLKENIIWISLLLTPPYANINNCYSIRTQKDNNFFAKQTKLKLNKWWSQPY